MEPVKDDMVSWALLIVIGAFWALSSVEGTEVTNVALIRSLYDLNMITYSEIIRAVPCFIRFLGHSRQWISWLPACMSLSEQPTLRECPQNTGHYSISHLPGMSLCCLHIVFSEEGDPKGQDVICLKGKADPYSSNRNFLLAWCFLAWSSIQTGSPPVHFRLGWALDHSFSLSWLIRFAQPGCELSSSFLY